MILNIVDEILKLASGRVNKHKPFVVAVDGRSASGKSTLTKELLSQLPASTSVIEGDDFYRVMSEIARLKLSPEQGVKLFFDWQRVIELLKSLKVGSDINYRVYKWGHNCLGDVKTICISDIVIIEGVYSSRPEFSSFIDYHILVETPYKQRLQRQLNRGENTYDIINKWAKAEELYFESIYNINANIKISGI